MKGKQFNITVLGTSDIFAATLQNELADAGAIPQRSYLFFLTAITSGRRKPPETTVESDCLEKRVGRLAKRPTFRGVGCGCEGP